jgi:hypothetical protein
MTLDVWLRSLANNRYRISARRLPMAARITVFALANSVLKLMEDTVYRHRVHRNQPQPPIFVVGHWRTGTTLLHELLILDRRFSYSTTYQCFAPHHFLLTSWIIPRVFTYLLPKRRPMDDMAVGWDRPQEDEFALCNFGVGSPYLRWAFPNGPNTGDDYLTLAGVSASDRRHWQETMRRLARRFTCGDPRRLVLKSPTHTARMKLLAETFPGSKFVHIVRDPYATFPSTVRTWHKLWDQMGLQVPEFRDVEEFVLQTFVRMYEQFEADRNSMPPGSLHDIRYEDLVRDPIGQMREVYRALDLGEFESVEPKLREYFQQTRDYRTNRLSLAPETRKKIAERWLSYFHRYGYAVE